jgi:hypothetical protein
MATCAVPGALSDGLKLSLQEDVAEQIAHEHGRSGDERDRAVAGWRWWGHGREGGA